MKAVDLFCGCGGISIGLQMAGFEILAGADIESKYITTFAHNFGQKKAYQVDLSGICPTQFMDLVGVQEGELAMLAGGPPCQGFSKNVPRKYRHLSDPNNLLVKTFLDYCAALKPRMILMENVAEMKNGFEQSYSNELINRLNEEGYSVIQIVLNAADYGVPQRRRRAFFLANRDGFELNPPRPTHAQPIESAQAELGLLSLPSHVNVWDAIGDLPSLFHGQGFEDSEYACSPFSEFQKLIRKDRQTVKNHVSRHLKPTQYARLASLQPGQGLKDLPPKLQVKSGYSGAYGRLTKNMVSPTITRWVFHPGSGRWGHPVDIRVLSIREVARLQSFPDNFAFVGTYTDQAGQLGNAVPPILIERISESMLDQIGLPIDSRSSISRSNDSFSSSDGKVKLIV